MIKKIVRPSLMLLVGIALVITLVFSMAGSKSTESCPVEQPDISHSDKDAGENGGASGTDPGKDDDGTQQDPPSDGDSISPETDSGMNSGSNVGTPDVEGSDSENAENPEVENGGTEIGGNGNENNGESNENAGADGENGTADGENGTADGEEDTAPSPDKDGSKDNTDTEEALPEGDGKEELDFAELLAQIAKGELGTKEKKYNNVKYNTWFYKRVVKATSSSSSSYAWCITFISWCADQAGISTDIIPKENNAERLRCFFIEQGLYEARKDHSVSVGDVIFYGKKSANHAGIVVEVTDTTVTVVEGNYSDKVSLVTYSLSSTSILGYATPDYNAGK